jgi:hypothetical protein
MNSKGQLTNKMGNLILVALVLGVLLIVFFLYLKPTFEDSGNIESVKIWVDTNAGMQKYTKGLVSTSPRPPIAELSDPFVIDSVEELNSQETKREIADRVYDCGNAFHFADPEKDFMAPLKVAKDGYVFCYTCSKIEFSQGVKDTGTDMKGLVEFMKTNSPYPSGQITYTQKINAMNPRLFSEAVTPTEDVITTDQNKYIMFIGTHNIDHQKAGCLIQREIGQFTGDTLAGAITAGINILGSPNKYWQAFLSQSKYNGMIMIASPDKVDGLCNYHKLKDTDIINDCADNMRAGYSVQDISDAYGMAV